MDPTHEHLRQVAGALIAATNAFAVEQVLGLAGLAQGVHRRVLDQPQLVGRGGVPLGGEVLHRPPGGFVGHAAGAADDHSTTFTIGWDDSSMYSASSWAWEVAFTVQVMAR